MMKQVLSAAHLLLIVYLAEFWASKRDVSCWNASWELTLTLYNKTKFFADGKNELHFLNGVAWE